MTMKAMVLAAGLGTRLGEITKSTPKCLVEAGGKTMLMHTLEALKRAGVTEAVVNLHHLSEKVRDYCTGLDGIGLALHFSPEEQLLGTGGALLHASRFFASDEDLIVHNADIYSSIDLKSMWLAHKRRSAIATLATMDRQTKRTLIFDDRNTLIGWRGSDNKVTPEGIRGREYAFCGVQIVSMRLIPFLLEESMPFSIIASYLNAAGRGELVEAFPVDGASWFDVGTPEKLEELRAELLRQKAAATTT